MKKAILFDLDGTLTDSGEGIMNCARLVLETYGIPDPGQAVLRTIVGPPLDDSLLRLGVPREKVEDGIRIFRGRYSTLGKYENFPYPGIDRLLARLRDQGHSLYVATSKPEVMALDILDHFHLAPYFTAICGASMDQSRSSKESVIAYLIKQYGLHEPMVMVGDTEFDVMGASRHRIPTIGVTWGYGDREKIRSAGAAALADTMEELYELLNQD